MDDFYFIPREGTTETLGTFKAFGTYGFGDALCRIELIKGICDKSEKRHLTEYPNIVKLCRLCMSDICKELALRINWETTLYRGYKDAFEKGGVSVDFLLKIKESMDCSAQLYIEYHSHYEEMKKLKLCTKACIICDVCYISEP